MNEDKCPQELMWQNDNCVYAVFLDGSGNLVLDAYKLKTKQFIYNGGLNESFQRRSRYSINFPIEDEDILKVKSEINKLPKAPIPLRKSNFQGWYGFLNRWEVYKYFDNERTILISFLPYGQKINWESIKLFLNWLVAPNQMWGRVLYKNLRRAALQRRTKEWDDVLSPQIVKWAWEQFDNWGRDGYHFMDNHRVARCGNSSQKRRYRKQKESGCCGSHGNYYLIGFNYGH